jgi:3-deoxy-7-phosphoheptulonate synthase
MKQVADLNIAENVPLPSPIHMMDAIARSESQADFVAASRERIQRILSREDPRFLLVVGPCSIHDVNAGREYAERMASLAQRVADRIEIVMRVYFEKPRTTVGWKGLIMDPHLDGSHDIPEGLRIARRFLRDVIDLGLPTATELLDPITPQYLADLICWSAIGARTSESQTHRQMASGLSMPIGFKNATSGSLGPAINAMQAAMQPQTFLGVNAQGVASSVTTRGNPWCHLILRGGDDGPNYEPRFVAQARDMLVRNHLREAILIDASHANCAKDHNRQAAVFRAIVDQAALPNSAVVGAMIESNLEAGNQHFPRPKESLRYGVSITDPCLDWAATEAAILEAHTMLLPTP